MPTPNLQQFEPPGAYTPSVELDLEISNEVSAPVDRDTAEPDDNTDLSATEALPEGPVPITEGLTPAVSSPAPAPDVRGFRFAVDPKSLVDPFGLQTVPGEIWDIIMCYGSFDQFKKCVTELPIFTP